MAVETFARTKIQPPRQRPGLLARARLAAPLAAALAEQRVVLVSAPAGFGKTVALTQQLSGLPAGTALAWVGADEGDDVARFASCLVAALDPFDLPWRVLPEALIDTLESGTDAIWRFATELLNALAAVEAARGLIVVDDLHRLADAAIHALLERLIERLPAAWGIVLVTRFDPPLPLMRWRARGELFELRQDELRFTADEVRVLAAGRGDAEALHRRSGGWAAGLGLLLGAGAPATAGPLADRHVFDYLASEVLDAMPAALREFLLRTSVLPELSAARCAAVAADERAAERLEAIERHGLFVSVLDEREPTLRLHDLFRDCLAERLQRERPHELPQLLVRAAASEPDPQRRIDYLARAGAWDEAERVLAAIGPELLAAGRVPQVLKLLGRFPAAQREQAPALLLLRGLAAWAHWDWLAMAAALAQAAAAFRARGDTAAALHADVLHTMPTLVIGGQAAAMPIAELAAPVASAPPDTRAVYALARCWHALGEGRLDEVAPAFAEIVGRLEQGAPAGLWLQCMPLTAYLGLPGMRRLLERYVAGALRLTADEPTSGLQVLARALGAGLEMMAGRSAAALAQLAGAAEDSRWLNRPPMQTTYLQTIAAFAHALGGDRAAADAAALSLIEGLDDDRSSGRRTTWLGHFTYLRLRIAAIGDDDAAQRELAAQLRGLALPGENTAFTRQRGSLEARLAAAEGRWREAADGYAAALAADETALDHYGQASELRVRWAHALAAGRRIDEAAVALRPALARARASGETAPLAFAGARALALLAGVAWGQRLDAAEQALLRAAVAPASPAAAPAAASSSPLTAREAAVLERIAAGDSNKLIARALDLSPHTVKRHVANILDKLGAESRGQAAAWHRSHG